uniref:SWIM-type domain-containing protein n=1 Tax=Lactuca sativa TaxID=4236 RepID=A0A9R1WFT5_LACSA|nr:hypothetical protein LSAT_V11C200057480 [Lactuca sativa]
MASSEEEWNDPFAALNEPFAGLNEMDFELHGIYMDHEPEDEFVSTLDKCKDNFLNVLLKDANLRNACMSNEMRARVYHENDWESDKDDEEEVQPKYRVHDPNIKWDKMEPKLGDIFESPEQLKFCVANYAVSHGYQIYFAKCDNVRIVAKCGKRNEDNQCPFRLHAAWMYKERSLQIKSTTRIHKCSRSFTFGSTVSPEWIGRHYMTEIANKPKLKLREMISDIKRTFRCDVSIGQYVDNKPNWTWFLELIHDDLMLDGGRGLVTISDQHKGLLEAVKDILPHVEHRQYARHIYANFKKAYTGLEFKRLFWASTMSCVEGDFKKHMGEIKKLSPAVENGILECFNSIIIEARKKPLITMLEEIRIYIMDRFWMVIHSQGSVFEARFNYESFKVDLEARTCTCRLWDISGIPCVHANAAINYIHKTTNGYINECFSKDKFIECYKSNIMPINGSNLWEQTLFQKPLPPIARRMLGRPATKRRRHSSEKETKFATIRVKVSITMRCGNFFEFGHNKQSCTSETKPRVPHAPKKIGRPRKNQEEHESATTETTINQNVDPNQASGSRRKTRRRSTETSNEPNQPTAQRRKINSRRGGGRAGGQNQENGKQKVDEGMVSQVIDEVGEGKSKSRKLSEILDDVEDGINEILRYIQEEEPEFLEVDDVQVDDVEVVDDVQVDEVVDDGQVDDVEVFADDEGDDEGVDKVQVEAGIEAAVEGVDDIVNNLPNLSTKTVHRKRKPSERILKLKLKKIVYDKDGGGSSATKPVKLD